MKKIGAKYKAAAGLIIIILILYIAIPLPYLDNPYSTVIYSQEGSLLGAKIAKDEQWRFPKVDSVPYKFKKSVLLFEDQHFFYHPGFNPVSIFRAIIQNIRAGEIISGGSTISMQVIRLARKGKNRTIREKIIEIFLATKLELKYSKSEILSMYTSHAPFGGNVVGLEAASWRYFGRPSYNLSWAESAALAVLPNAPSLIYPGKNKKIFKEKRDRLLTRLLDNNILDSITWKLSLKEGLPQKPKNLPQKAPHLLTKCIKYHEGKNVRTTLQSTLQAQTNDIVKRHSNRLKANEIHNAAILVVEVVSGNIVAYTGNTSGEKKHGNDVDIITSPRSTGSILKPILYASMLNDGELLPNMLIPDIPVFLDGFSPKNYSLRYDGAVPASRALSRSLNVPAVYLLSKYGVDRFYDQLKKLNFSFLNNPPDHYGLSLILGGSEASLWDLCRVYANMANVLVKTVDRNYQYDTEDYNTLNYVFDNKIAEKESNLSKSPHIFSAASIWFTLEALLEVNRPENETGWKFFSSSDKIAWKTGTSFGFRDAWAIGITPKYVVGVWAGNADGEGRPGLTGVTAASPILFDVFNILEKSPWFQKPYDEIKEVPLCSKTGYLASVNCTEIDTIGIPSVGLRTNPCKYHKTISLDKSGRYRVFSGCVEDEKMIRKSWFVLPPVMEYYYRQKNPSYKPLPPYKPGCNPSLEEQIMDFVYPEKNSKIYIPKNLSGKRSKTVFSVAHREKNCEL
ncbi:MAG: penicillin-binding protein 1C, partial [Bacteroidales bacterium]|nr:penicillin-binding protein 1C [Bacteroidales bacterium]